MSASAPPPDLGGADGLPKEGRRLGPWRRSLASSALPLVTAAAVLTGTVLRFRSPSPLWLDEARSVAIARLPLHILPQALRHDGAPPVYYALLHVWMQGFGDGDAAVRSLSGLCSVPALPLFWLWAALLGGPRLASLTRGFAAVSPWLIRYATEARMYSPVVLLVLVLALALRRLRERPGPASTVMTGTVGGLLLLTHYYWALFLLTAVALIAVLRWLCRRRQTADARTLPALVLSACAFLPWTPVFAFQLRHTGTPRATGATWHSLTATVGYWSTGGRPLRAPLSLLLWPSLPAGACLRREPTGRRRLVTAGSTRSPIDAVVVVTVTTLVLAYTTCRVLDSAFVSRYSAVVVAPVVLIAAFGAALLFRGALLAAVFALMAAWLAVAALNLAVPRTQAAQISAVLNRRAAADDSVVFCRSPARGAGCRCGPGRPGTGRVRSLAACRRLHRS